jgi:hypothetical protein
MVCADVRSTGVDTSAAFGTVPFVSPAPEPLNWPEAVTFVNDGEASIVIAGVVVPFATERLPVAVTDVTPPPPPPPDSACHELPLNCSSAAAADEYTSAPVGAVGTVAPALIEVVTTLSGVSVFTR